ncbi:MAG: hypothetical protein M1355_04280 [Patescibacteria group bacterium]|nr:hypothetical protein [Patescibacteria group bacterium]
MVTIVPKTKSGKWSVGLILAMPILFFTGGFLANTLYKEVAADSIIGDLTGRPLLSLSMLAGIASGVSAFVTGIVAFIRQKERALLVYLSIAFGGMLVLLLLGEVFVSH